MEILNQCHCLFVWVPEISDVPQHELGLYKKYSITFPAKVPDIHRNKLIFFICYNLKYNRIECLVILISKGILSESI